MAMLKIRCNRAETQNMKARFAKCVPDCDVEVKASKQNQDNDVLIFENRMQALPAATIVDAKRLAFKNIIHLLDYTGKEAK